MNATKRGPAITKNPNVFLIEQHLEFPKYIKRCREYKGMNQQELASEAGITGAYVCVIEKGSKLPSEKICVRLAAALGRPTKEVIGMMRIARLKGMPEVAGKLEEEDVSIAQYNAEMNQFLDAYKKLSVEDKQTVDGMISRFTRLLEGRRAAAN